MDTERDWDIALLEIQMENEALVREFYAEKLGRRTERMTNGEGSERGNDQGSETATNQTASAG